MFNVLPDLFKEEIKNDYKLRRLLVIILFVLFLQISFLIFLFPSWMISVVKEREVIYQKQDVDTSSAAQNAEGVSSFITKTNLKLKNIDKALTYPKLIPFVQIVLTNKPNGIILNEFLYTSKDQTSATLSLTGSSSTRESLVLFVKNLEKSGMFKAVDSPVSNFTKDKDIKFSVSLSIAQ